MSITGQQHPTVEDLYKIEGKAELVGGRIVRLLPTGRKRNRVAGRIYRRLDEHAEATGRGEAYTDNIGFAVPELSSGRQSFSPDASYYMGPLPEDDMRFLSAPPVFAVDVRSRNDYGSTAERAVVHLNLTTTEFRSGRIDSDAAESWGQNNRSLSLSFCPHDFATPQSPQQSLDSLPLDSRVCGTRSMPKMTDSSPLAPFENSPS